MVQPGTALLQGGGLRESNQRRTTMVLAQNDLFLHATLAMVGYFWPMMAHPWNA